MSFVLRSLFVTAAIAGSVHQLAEGQTIRRALKHIFCHRCSRYDCGCTSRCWSHRRLFVLRPPPNAWEGQSPKVARKLAPRSIPWSRRGIARKTS